MPLDCFLVDRKRERDYFFSFRSDVSDAAPSREPPFKAADQGRGAFLKEEEEKSFFRREREGETQPPLSLSLSLSLSRACLLSPSEKKKGNETDRVTTMEERNSPSTSRTLSQPNDLPPPKLSSPALKASSSGESSPFFEKFHIVLSRITSLCSRIGRDRRRCDYFLSGERKGERTEIPMPCSRQRSFSSLAHQAPLPSRLAPDSPL